MNRYRKFISTGLGFSFLVVGITGIIFKFFFKNHTLEDIHAWLGIAMVVTAVFHIFQNWTSLNSYFKDRRVFALLIPVVITIAFLSLFQKEGAKKDGINPREVVHKLSEGSLANVAKAFGQDLNSVSAALESKGIHIANSDETIEALADANHLPPEAILAYFVK